jgi:hypothetical protein
MVVMPIATSLSTICWRSSFKWDHCSFFMVLLWGLVPRNSVFLHGKESLQWRIFMGSHGGLEPFNNMAVAEDKHFVIG